MSLNLKRKRCMFFLRKTSLIAVCAAALLTACAQMPSSGGEPDFSSQQTRCLTDSEIVQWSRTYAVRRPLNNPPTGMTAEDAACTRAKFQQQLAHMSGPHIGYKVALTNREMQKSFRVSEPVWGSYYHSMLLPSRSSVDARFGAHSLYMASLLVRVKSAAVNEARTPQEVLAQVDQVIPYIELNDVMVQKPSQLTAANFAAINAGARLGIMGEPLAVSGNANTRKRMLRELQNMSVRVIGNNGRLLARGKGSDIPGHPLQSVIWLSGALRQQGQSLKPGQWISLGTLSPMLRPKAGERITVAYPGLTGARSVIVNFK